MVNIEEICAEFGVVPRTVRRWVRQGIIDPPKPHRGKYARYPHGTISRIRLYRRITIDGRITAEDLSQIPQWWKKAWPQTAYSSDSTN